MSQPMSLRPSKKPAAKKATANSSQQIIVICGVLVFGLVCFMFGILLGRADRGVDVANRAPDVRMPKLETTVDAGAPHEGDRKDIADDGEGVQTSPRPVRLPERPARTAATTPPDVETRPLAPQRENKNAQSGKRVADQGDVPDVKIPEIETQSSAAVAKSPDPKKATPEKSPSAESSGQVATSPEKAPETKPAQASSTQPQPKEESKATAPAPKQAAEPAASAPPEKPVSKPEAVAETKRAAASAGSGANQAWAYGVQVASFAGSKRQELAEDYQRHLEANSELQAQLYPSEDGNYVRVVVGGYADKAAAAAACQELRKRAGFKDCFVKMLR